MRPLSTLLLALLLLVVGASIPAAQAQCSQTRYVSDGSPATADCQPVETLEQVAPAQMSSAAQDLAATRHAELVEAARFYGFNLDAPGWTYQQSVSPILRKHLLLTFTGAASHFVAVLPASRDERVQVVPTVAHGLRLFEPGWQTKGTQAVFNRLMQSEHGMSPISESYAWIQYASLYIALCGEAPVVPTSSSSVPAGWELARRRATTPVIVVNRNGGAVITVSELTDAEHTSSWSLSFDPYGLIRKVERQSFRPETIRTLQTRKDPPAPAAPLPSALNP